MEKQTAMRRRSTIFVGLVMLSLATPVWALPGLNSSDLEELKRRRKAQKFEQEVTQAQPIEKPRPQHAQRLSPPQPRALDPVSRSFTSLASRSFASTAPVQRLALPRALAAVPQQTLAGSVGRRVSTRQLTHDPIVRRLAAGSLTENPTVKRLARLQAASRQRAADVLARRTGSSGTLGASFRRIARPTGSFADAVGRAPGMTRLPRGLSSTTPLSLTIPTSTEGGAR